MKGTRKREDTSCFGRDTEAETSGSIFGPRLNGKTWWSLLPPRHGGHKRSVFGVACVKHYCSSNAWRTPKPADVAEDLRDIEGVDLRDGLQRIALLVNNHRHVGERILQARSHLASNIIATRKTAGNGAGLAFELYLVERTLACLEVVTQVGTDRQTKERSLPERVCTKRGSARNAPHLHRHGGLVLGTVDTLL